MNKDKRETEYPVELESQFIMRLPDEPAKALRDLIKSGENFRNRLTISLENDMRNGEIRFDHWLLHAKIVDLPTIIESLKTIDRKSVYKTANICQLMLCKDEIDCSTEEEMPNKKKKDPLKVDKKFLWPHGITPPTKNIRKRRFRKTLRKKCAEAPEIEKEVKRLLRADNEAISVTWEVIKDENENTKNDSPLPDKPKSKKNNHKIGFDLGNNSKVEDIFGGAVSDSDGDDENIDIEDGRLSVGDGHFSDSNSIQDSDFKGKQIITQFKSEMFTSHDMVGHNSTFNVKKKNTSLGSVSNACRENYQHDYNENTPENVKLQQLNTELEELKLRKHRTQLEISGLQNMSLKQRFQDILQTLNNEIRYKEVEIKKMSK